MASAWPRKSWWSRELASRIPMPTRRSYFQSSTMNAWTPSGGSAGMLVRPGVSGSSVSWMWAPMVFSLVSSARMSARWSSASWMRATSSPGRILATTAWALPALSAGRVVRALSLTDSAVGLTLLALATTAELFALAWAAMRRGVSEIAVAGVVGSVAYNATATLGVAALVRPLTVGGLLWPAVTAAALPVVLLAAALRGRLNRWAGALLVAAYAGWVTVVLRP